MKNLEAIKMTFEEPLAHGRNATLLGRIVDGKRCRPCFSTSGFGQSRSDGGTSSRGRRRRGRLSTEGWPLESISQTESPEDTCTPLVAFAFSDRSSARAEGANADPRLRPRTAAGMSADAEKADRAGPGRAFFVFIDGGSSLAPKREPSSARWITCSDGRSGATKKIGKGRRGRSTPVIAGGASVGQTGAVHESL